MNDIGKEHMRPALERIPLSHLIACCKFLETVKKCLQNISHSAASQKPSLPLRLYPELNTCLVSVHGHSLRVPAELPIC